MYAVYAQMVPQIVYIIRVWENVRRERRSSLVSKRNFRKVRLYSITEDGGHVDSQPRLLILWFYSELASLILYIKKDRERVKEKES